MDGIVDVYMPDFKLWSQEPARRYLQRREYPEVAREAIREMSRQVGPLRLDGRGLARRGLLVRHLVMPGMIEETKAILRFLAEEIGPGTYVNVMAQYHPAGRVGEAGRYPEIDRLITRDEYTEAVAFAHELGLRVDGRRPRSLALV
jgi:putative pyruvate formate lyase activating enzyme